MVLACLALVLACTPQKQDQAPTPERVLEWPEFENSATAIRATRKQTIATAAAQLEAIVEQDPQQLSFASTVVALDALIHEFTKHWNRMDLLQNVSPDEQVREAASEAAVALEQWYTESIVLGEPLYAVIEAFATTGQAAALTGADRLLLDETLADFRREGLTLSPEDRARITEWQARLTALTTTIGLAINADEGIVAFDREQLEGLSDEQLQAFDPDTGQYLVRTSLRPQYNAVMKHAVRRETRRQALEANLRRAMAANAAPIHEVLQLRTEVAQLLGYPTWADYRIEPRMAESAEVARGFILDLDRRIEPIFAAEQLRLRDLTRAELDDPGFAVADLQLEDIPYYLNLLLERDYAVEEQVVRQYFAERDFLRRVFDLYEQVFGLEIAVVIPAQAWAEDVEVALISDAASKRLLGAIYLDLHPRPGKYTHYASFDLIGGRRLAKGRYQAPICAIVGNFSVPVGDQPALWSMDEVGIFLHELGHALHEVLTTAEHFTQAGTNVPLDFVEVPSQTLERWVRDPAVLRRLAVHYQTGEPMPDDLIARLISASYVGVGHLYARDVAYGMVDFEIHTYGDPTQVPASGEAVYERTNAVFSEHYYALPSDSALLASFGHLFAGYDAGYYSYDWSDVLAADIASVFAQSKLGFNDPVLGARLRREVYEVGSSRPINESMHAFLGRDWTLDAFLAELSGGG